MTRDRHSLQDDKDRHSLKSFMEKADVSLERMERLAREILANIDR